MINEQCRQMHINDLYHNIPLRQVALSYRYWHSRIISTQNFQFEMNCLLIIMSKTDVHLFSEATISQSFAKENKLILICDIGGDIWQGILSWQSSQLCWYISGYIWIQNCIAWSRLKMKCNVAWFKTKCVLEITSNIYAPKCMWVKPHPHRVLISYYLCRHN